MAAPTLDLPSGQTAGATRREWVTNTQLPKRANQHQSDYYFDGGFYQSAQIRTSHPVEEVSKKRTYQRVKDLADRFNKVLPEFNDIKFSVQVKSIGQLAYMLLSGPFQQITMEKTPDESLLVKAVWYGKNVFIDIDFNTDEPAGYEMSITAYDGHKAVLSVAGPFDFAFGRLLSLTQQPV